jgi:ABC-2 type transport system permease protein
MSVAGLEPMAAPRPMGLRAYSGFVEATFHKMLAYRLRYVTGIVSYLVYVTTYYFLWKAAYASLAPGETTIRGYTFTQMITYIAVGWCSRSFYFNNVDREIAEQVQNGTIGIALARPVSFQGTVVAGALGEAFFRLVFLNVPISVAIFLLFPVSAPASTLHAAAFALSLVLALLVLVHLNFLVGMCAFPLKNIDGVMRAKHYMLELLSGLLIAVDMFPGWLNSLSQWLPFQAIAFIPNSIWLGRVESHALGRALGLQAAWVIGLAAACALVWSRAMKRLTVQGG